MFCKKCGNKIPDSSNFCDKCGTLININEKSNTKHISTNYKCDQCEKENNRNSIFCKYCGINLPYKVCRYCGYKLNTDSIFCEKCGEKQKTIDIKNNEIKKDAEKSMYKISLGQLIVLIIFGIVAFVFCESYSSDYNDGFFGLLSIIILFLIPFYTIGWIKYKKRI